MGITMSTLVSRGHHSNCFCPGCSMLHAAPLAPVLPDGRLQQQMVEPLDLKRGAWGNSIF